MFKMMLERYGLELTTITLDVHGISDSLKTPFFLRVVLFYKTVDLEAQSEETRSKFQEQFQRWYKLWQL